MPYNPFSPTSNEEYMGKTPLDKMGNKAGQRYRNNKIATPNTKYTGGANATKPTSLKKKKKKKFSLLNALR